MMSYLSMITIFNEFGNELAQLSPGIATKNRRLNA